MRPTENHSCFSRIKVIFLSGIQNVFMLKCINGERRENGILKRVLYLMGRKLKSQCGSAIYDTLQGDHEVSLCAVSLCPKEPLITVNNLGPVVV